MILYTSGAAVLCSHILETAPTIGLYWNVCGPPHHLTYSCGEQIDYFFPSCFTSLLEPGDFTADHLIFMPNHSFSLMPLGLISCLFKATRAEWWLQWQLPPWHHGSTSLQCFIWITWKVAGRLPRGIYFKQCIARMETTAARYGERLDSFLLAMNPMIFKWNLHNQKQHSPEYQILETRIWAVDAFMVCF